MKFKQIIKILNVCTLNIVPVNKAIMNTGRDINEYRFTDSPHIDITRSPGFTRTLNDSPNGETYCSVFLRYLFELVTSEILIQPTSPPKYFEAPIGRGDAPLLTFANEPISATFSSPDFFRSAQRCLNHLNRRQARFQLFGQ